MTHTVDRDLSIPPHSAIAEEHVLGAVLKHPPAMALVFDLAAEDFYRPQFRHIWAAMRALFTAQRPIDYATLADELQRHGTYDAAGGLAQLTDLSIATPTAAFIEHYAGIVRRSATNRRLISAAAQVAEVAWKDGDENDALAFAANAIQGVRRASANKRRQDPESWVLQMQDDLAQRQQRGLAGISTGFRDIDAMTLGLSPGDLVLVAARMGVGKTAVVQQMAHTAENYGPVLFISQEMSPTKIGERAIAQRTGISRSRLRRMDLSDQEWQQVHEAAEALAKGALHICYGSYTVAEIRAEAHELQAAMGSKPALVVVDYLQLLGDTAGTQSKRHDDVGAAAKRLKDLAIELDCPVLVPTQLNRDADGQVPALGDIADSDIPARVADVVLALHRRELSPPFDAADRGVMEVYVLKSRDLSDGPTMAKLVWAGEAYRDMVWRAAA